jgi:GntR family transcriptional regulator of vanillate catabolism
MSRAAGEHLKSEPSQTNKALMGMRELILGGELRPGDAVLEIPVSERLGVSRTPVRAALVRLAEEGLLDRSGSNYTVRAFTLTDIQDAIEMRGTVEGAAARLAAERGVGFLALTPLHETLAHLDVLLHRETALSAERPLDLIDRYMDLNAVFHRQLSGLTGSFVISRTLDHISLLPFASPSAMVFRFADESDVWKTFLTGQEQHRALVEAIDHREGTRAEAIAREHARLSLRALQSALKDSGIQHLPGIALLLNPG